MPTASWSFQLTYWGTTGSFPRALTPAEVELKIIRTVRHLAASSDLAQSLSSIASDAEVEEKIARLVPADQRTMFGGNTTCLEVRTPDALFVVDAGTGLQPWARSTQSCWNAAGYKGQREGHLLMTHAHLDHACGLAFADAFYDPRNRFTIWGTQEVIDQLRELLNTGEERRNLLLPVSLCQLSGVRELKVLPPSLELTIAGTRIAALPLNHPGHSLAYRFERSGKRLVIATDHEHREVPDRTLAAFANGSDLLYLDGQYLQCEYDGERGIGAAPARPRLGWGHSPVEASIATAVAAGAKMLHLGHHDPHRTDEELGQLECYVQSHVRRLHVEGSASVACEVALARESATWTI
jgi:phosphoribosyl 1,2-cyclic phosphodiesterase